MRVEILHRVGDDAQQAERHPVPLGLVERRDGAAYLLDPGLRVTPAGGDVVIAVKVGLVFGAVEKSFLQDSNTQKINNITIESETKVLIIFVLIF